jgi:hypothetical protein
MPAVLHAKPPNTITRIVLWFAALLLAALLFSAWLSRGLPNLDIVRFTLIFALPAWLLYLPLVFAYSRAAGDALRVLLVVGFLIGPASIAVWSVILPSHGRTDPEVGGLGEMIVSGAIVGSLTTIFYVSALRLLQMRAASVDGS